jgi:hypothetical protein
LWDEELLQSLFWDVDANRGMEIPIAPPVMDDLGAWHHTNNGTFTIQSAYHVEWDYRFGKKKEI